MKKVVLSCVVILAFIIYSMYQRTKGAEELPITLSKNSVSTPAPTETPLVATNQSVPTDTHTSTPSQNGGFKDGSYTGSVEDAFYGNIQVQATISGGRLTDVQFLQYPNDRHDSIEINSQSNPILAQEAIQAQSAHVDIVSGATDSSEAFVRSLQSALDKAKG